MVQLINKLGLWIHWSSFVHLLCSWHFPERLHFQAEVIQLWCFSLVLPYFFVRRKQFLLFSLGFFGFFLKKYSTFFAWLRSTWGNVFKNYVYRVGSSQENENFHFISTALCSFTDLKEEFSPENSSFPEDRDYGFFLVATLVLSRVAAGHQWLWMCACICSTAYWRIAQGYAMLPSLCVDTFIPWCELTAPSRISHLPPGTPTVCLCAQLPSPDDWSSTSREAIPLWNTVSPTQHLQWQVCPLLFTDFGSFLTPLSNYFFGVLTIF